jgi:hypothetical protein
MKAYFLGGEIHQVDVNGSVRVVYYPMDSKDSTLMFMNVSETSLLNVYLKDRKMYKMMMSPKSNGTLYPMEDLPKDKMRLDQFVWFDYIRPLDKDDIFNWRPKHADQVMKKSKRGTAPLPNQQLFKEVKKKPEDKAVSKTETEVKTVSEPETETEVKTETGTEVKTETEIGVKTVSESETETKEENKEINKEDDKDGNVQNG